MSMRSAARDDPKLVWAPLDRAGTSRRNLLVRVGSITSAPAGRVNRRIDPVCGELLISPESAIRHTQVWRAALINGIDVKALRTRTISGCVERFSDFPLAYRRIA